MDACDTCVCGKCERNLFGVHGKCVSLRKCLVTFYYLSSAGRLYLSGMLGNVVFGVCGGFFVHSVRYV